MRGWEPSDDSDYRKSVEAKITDAEQNLEFLTRSLEERCLKIEDILVQAGGQAQPSTVGNLDESEADANKRIHSLITARRQARTRGDKVSEIRLAKLVQKEIRAITDARKRGKIEKILREFKGLKQIAGIKAGGRRNFIGSVLDSEGVRQTDRQDVADVFADFYAELYACRNSGKEDESQWDSGGYGTIASITTEDLRTQLGKMAGGKCEDSRGVVMELLKHSGDELLQIVADTFNEILRPNAEVPPYWKANIVKVLHKKGDTTDVANYRPITLLPILYKLFSKVVCSRVSGKLLEAQAVEQAGFRPGFSCDDHIFVLTLVSEMYAEFRRPLWIVAVDFQKAFDSIDQSSLWKALVDQNVPGVYVNFLRKLYDGQVGQVKTDQLSKPFQIQRGTRQGDPLSPLLFNAALENLMRQLQGKWSTASKKYGIKDGESRLTHLRFADDLLLFAPSLSGAQAMLSDLVREAAKYGLEVHSSKTKIMWNGEGKGTTLRQTDVNNKSFEILQGCDSTLYLGKLFSFEDMHDLELKNRVGKAWAKFGMYNAELTDKRVDLKTRMKLFKSVVQPTFLYGCVSWTLTREREQLIQRTQRRMMRRIVGTKRSVQSGELEEWVAWIIRATRTSETAMEKHKVPDWVEEVHRRRYNWASKVAGHQDGRWTKQILLWNIDGRRRRRRPLTRWTESFARFFEYAYGIREGPREWLKLAECEETWRAMEQDYLNFTLNK